MGHIRLVAGYTTRWFACDHEFTLTERVRHWTAASKRELLGIMNGLVKYVIKNATSRLDCLRTCMTPLSFVYKE